MAVRIEKTFRVQEPVEKVWKFLSDPRKVVTCVPGAQITEAIDERTFKGSISVRVGPSVTDYRGEVRIERLDPAAHEIELVGKGQDVRGKGSASMKMTGKLNALPDGETEVVGISEVNVVGMLAQFGARMINDVSDVIFGEFTENFQRLLKQEGATDSSASTDSGPAAPPKPVNAVPIVLSATRAGLSRFFGHVFGGSKKE
jgi:uncharacterized protein